MFIDLPASHVWFTGGWGSDGAPSHGEADFGGEGVKPGVEWGLELGVCCEAPPEIAGNPGFFAGDFREDH